MHCLSVCVCAFFGASSMTMAAFWFSSLMRRISLGGTASPSSTLTTLSESLGANHPDCGSSSASSSALGKDLPNYSREFSSILSSCLMALRDDS